MQNFEQQQLLQQPTNSILILSRTFSYFQTIVSIAAFIFIELVFLKLKTIQSTVPSVLIDFFILAIFIFMLNFIFQLLYFEQITLTDLNFIHKRYFLFIPIPFLSKVYAKNDFKLSLIPQDLSKNSFLLLFLVYIQVNPRLNWLVLQNEQKKVYLFGFINPEEIKSYTENLIDFGVKYDESLEELMENPVKNDVER